MDYIYNVLTLAPTKTKPNNLQPNQTPSIPPLAENLLRPVLPLPHHTYTLKYWLFSHLANHRPTRLLLRLIARLLPKET